MADIEFNAAIGETLRGLREEARITQPELAAMMNVHTNTVYNWERGQGSISMAQFYRACHALKRNAAEVLATICG